MSTRSTRVVLVPLVALAVLAAGLIGATPAYGAKKFKGVDKPSIVGTVAVGQKVSVVRDTVTKPVAAKVTYRWLRNGKSISKATKSSYTPVSADKGKKLSVKVCYKKSKYSTKCVKSAATVVAAAVPVAPPTPTPPTTPATPVPLISNEPAISVSQQQALRSAESYLRFMAFSRSGLIGQLEYEGFSTADAVYAVDHVNADWFAQAVLCAQSYLRFMPFSRSGLIAQLEYEGFTPEQAEYATTAVGL